MSFNTMPFDPLLILPALLSIASIGTSLLLLELDVPPVVDVREKAVLICKFDPEGDMFFSLKWYKEELEFFRYMPDNVPRIQTFPVDGVQLVVSESNMSVVTLSPLQYKTTGVYRCEVSAGPPYFKVAYRNANMTVLGLPEDDPKIRGLKESYAIGSYVAANCTSSPSYPPARMSWYINGKKAQHWLTDQYYVEQPENELNLETRAIGLKFQTDNTHSRDNSMYLKCTSTVGDLTRSTEARIYLSKATREKFSLRFSNGPNAIPNISVLTIAAINVIYPRAFK